jgi:hypothetical protein
MIYSTVIMVTLEYMVFILPNIVVIHNYFAFFHFRLKVLSSEMEPAQIRLTHSIGRLFREARKVLRKIQPPPILEHFLKY